jgi:5-deoxy-5-amino-3-dehydroquinate synthase
VTPFDLDNVRQVPVGLGDRSYEVTVGRNVVSRLADLLPPRARLAGVVIDEALGIEIETARPGFVHRLPGGEAAKSFATVEELCRAFARGGLSSADVVVAVGGGALTDVVGFAAGVYHRGVAVVHVPTTLLGQIDAAIGGKTAVNLPEGKNLAGVFWQPHAVICDTDLLAGLPEAEWRSGRGEMAKYCLLGLPHLPELSLEAQIGECVAAKARLVAADERDSSERMLLNYGHTLGHALEGITRAADEQGRSERLSHGEAVAIGLVFAGELARVLGRIGDEAVAGHRAVLERFGLSGELPSSVVGREIEDLLVFVGRDKKARHSLTFVLDGPSGVEVVDDVPVEAVAAAWQKMQAARKARSR